GRMAKFVGSAAATRAMPNLIAERSKKRRCAASALTSPAERPIHQSLTRDYLSGRKSIPIPKSRRKFSSVIKLAGATEHNLKDLSVEIPLGIFTAITGVSGSGKSTLIQDVLYRNLLRAKGQASENEPGACRTVTGAHRFDEIV